MPPDRPFYRVLPRADGAFDLALECPRRGARFVVISALAYTLAVALLRALEPGDDRGRGA